MIFDEWPKDKLETLVKYYAQVVHVPEKLPLRHKIAMIVRGVTERIMHPEAEQAPVLSQHRPLLVAHATTIALRYFSSCSKRKPKCSTEYPV